MCEAPNSAFNDTAVFSDDGTIDDLSLYPLAGGEPWLRAEEMDRAGGYRYFWIRIGDREFDVRVSAAGRSVRVNERHLP